MNYYLVNHTTEERLHVGRAVLGWAFALRVYPEKLLRNPDEWRAFLVKSMRRGSPWWLEDDTGKTVALDALMCLILEAHPHPDQLTRPPHFYYRNGAVRDPVTGLARHRVDGKLCVAHGDGPWDCMAREFS